MKNLTLLLILHSFFVFSQDKDTGNTLKIADSLFKKTAYKKAQQFYDKVTKIALNNNEIQYYVYAELQKIKIKSSFRNHKVALRDISLLKKYIKKNKVKNDSIWVALINLNSIILKHTGKFDKALNLNNQLLTKKKEFANFIEEIYHTRSRIEIDLGKFDDAIFTARKTIPIYKIKKDSLNLAAIYNIIGVGYYFKQDLDSTLYYYLKSLTIKNSIKKDDAQLAISSYNIGIVYEDMANYKDAIKYYLDAVSYDLKNGGESIGFLIEIYGALVNTYGNMQDFDNAEKYANKLSVLMAKNNEEEYPYLTFSYIAYSGLKEMQQDYKTAIKYVKKALKIRLKTYGENHKWTLECWVKLGDYYTQLANFKEAKINYEKALQIANRIKDKEKTVAISKGLGHFFLLQKEYTNAQKSFSYALNNVSDKFFETKELLYELNYLKAKTYYLQNELIVAKTYIDNLKKISVNNSSLYINYLNVLDLENKILIKSFEENQLFNNLNEILHYLSKVKNSYSSANSKIYASNNFDAIIDNSVTICYDLYVKTKNSKYKIKALEFSEFNRNATLLEGLQNVAIKQKVGVPNKILQAENSFREKIAKIKQELFYLKEDKNKNQIAFNKLSTDYISLSEKLDSLQQVIERQYPNYYQLKNISNKFDFTKIQQNIKKEELIIEYYFSNNYLYVFYLEKESLALYKIENSTDLNKQIVTFRKRLKQRKDVSEITNSIYNSIIPKSLKVQNIKIIADGSLNFFPFECLKKDAKYLIETKSISYAGSLNLMWFQEKISQQKNKNNWLGFAPNYKNSTNLSFNVDEIKSIQQITNGSYFIDDNASKANFLKHSKNSDIIHLATHTVLNNSNSLYNKLLFTDFEQNHTLTASEIYNLDFKAKLVVLSSCNTGYGTIDKGEGIQNMSRAFTYAGIPSTIMSLWKVPDKETNAIMQSFYSYLKKGNSKSESLQKAKLAYLNSTNDKFLKHPYFWAGFVVNGDASSLYQKQTNFWYYVIGFIILALILKYKKKILQNKL